MSDNDLVTQRLIDAFYIDGGKKPCCAGCDHWYWESFVLGECQKSPLVSAEERLSVLGVSSLSFNVSAGKIMTGRSYSCGGFEDTYEWGV